MTDDEKYMTLALREARKAAAQDEVPVGAVIVKDGIVIARAHNQKERNGCAVDHAEIIAIRRASKKVGNWWLEGCTLYVTLEPCAMCAGAIVNARLDRVVYGARDPRFGFLGSLATLDETVPLNHTFPKEGGVLGTECGTILTEFFAAKRAKSKKN